MKLTGPDEITMRSPAEIQWAHDLLGMLPQCPGAAAIPYEGRMLALVTVTTLCWVLRHEEGQEMEALLEAAEATMKAGGYAGPEDERPA